MTLLSFGLHLLAADLILCALIFALLAGCQWWDDRRGSQRAAECPTADEWDASRGLADYRDLPVRDAADLMFVDEVVAEWEATS